MGRAVDLDRLPFGVASDKTKSKKNQGDGQSVPERPDNINEHLSTSFYKSRARRSITKNDGG